MESNDPQHMPPSGNGWRRDGMNGRGPAQPAGDRGDIHEDEIDLRKLLKLFFRHKWLIASVTFVTMALAVGLAWWMTPIYQSEGTLLISESRNRYSYAGSDLSNLLTTSYGIGMGSTLANELQILTSRKLSYTLADTLLEEQTDRAGNLYPLLYTDYPDDPAIAGRDTVAYRIRERLEVAQIDRESDAVEISFESPSPYEAAHMVDLTIETYTRLSTEQNRVSASSALEFLKGEKERIEQNLRENEERLREYMQENEMVQVDTQTEKLIETLTELENERQAIRTRLASIGSAIEDYSRELDGIKEGFSEQFKNNVGPKLNRYQYQLAEYETEKMLLLARNPELRENPESHPRLKELNENIELIQASIDEQTAKLFDGGTDRYLGFLSGLGGGSASDNVGTLYRKLLELNIEQSQYRAQAEVLDRRIAGYEQVFDNLPDNMIELARLKREVRINEELFVTVSNQYAEMSLWEQTQFGLGRPIDYGYIPSEPVFPNMPLFGLVGLILGGILSIGLVFTRESLNRKLDGVEKLEELNVPVLAVIPDFGETIRTRFPGEEKVTVQNREVATGLITLLDSFSPAAEAFRRLQNNVVFAHPDRNYRTLMITSSSKGEGKSTVTANLAVILSESGERVLVLDADFRRPFVHACFGVPVKPGITEYLFEGLPMEEIVQETLVENVDIIATGKRPPNPTAISQSRKFREMIRELQQRYDYVLIDTAPYGIITDAGNLISDADGVLVVARFNETRRDELEHTLANLEKVNANVLGTVLTWFDYRKSSDYYHSDDYYKRAFEAYEKYNEGT